MNEDIFNTPEEEIVKLSKEIKGLKETLQEMSRTLARLETRVQRAFPLKYPKKSEKKVKKASSLHEEPTLTPEQALTLYEELIVVAKNGDMGNVEERLLSMNKADLALLRQELGVSLGKKKPSQKILIEVIMGRIRESIMLSKHMVREEIINYADSVRNSTNESIVKEDIGSQDKDNTT